MEKEDRYRFSLTDSILLPCGLFVWDLFHRKGKRSPKEGSLEQTFEQKLGGSAGRAGYREFQGKRIGVLMALTLFFLIVFLLGEQPWKEGPPQAPELRRASHGQGSRNERLTLVLENEDERAEKTLTVSVPQKDLSDEEENELLLKAMDWVRERLDGKTVSEAGKLPTSSGEVTFQYASLTPEWIRSDGTLLKTPGAEERELFLRVTGRLGDQRQTVIVRLIQPSLADLSPEERLDNLVTQVEEGQYLTDEGVDLPSVNEAGDLISVVPAGSKGSGRLYLGLYLLMALFLWYFQQHELLEGFKKRDRRILIRLPELTGELAILTGAGLSLPSALIRLGRDYRESEKGDDPLYEEIARMAQQMEEGISFREAAEQLMVRVEVPQVRRLFRMLLQSERRGGSLLLDRLTEYTEDAWEERKKQVRELSEVADTKLTFPLMLLLVAVLIIVLAPSLLTLS